MSKTEGLYWQNVHFVLVAAGCRKSLLGGALGGTRTPNLLIRSQMLYPLSYKRWDA